MVYNVLVFFIIKRLSEATEYLSWCPQTEVWGFGIISGLRPDSASPRLVTIPSMAGRMRSMLDYVLCRGNNVGEHAPHASLSV